MVVATFDVSEALHPRLFDVVTRHLLAVPRYSAKTAEGIAQKGPYNLYMPAKKDTFSQNN